MVVFNNVKREDLENLFKHGFSKEETKTIYEEERLRYKDVNLIYYTSGKLLLQGKQSSVEEVVALIEKNGIGDKVRSEQFRKEVGWVIGSDESLKGDTFGGLVVAAVKADDQVRAELKQIGVADSKKLNDKEILLMAEKVKSLAACYIKNLMPEEYNSFQGNVTKLLNKLHLECANYLQPGKHVVDLYPGCNVGDIQETKAESKFIEVAAASVLARSVALQQLDNLSIQAGFTLPKGSTHVELALDELKSRGKDFKKFVKVNFSNVQRFM